MTSMIPEVNSNLSRLLFIGNVALFAVLAWVAIIQPTPIIENEENQDYVINCRPFAASPDTGTYYLQCARAE